MIQRQPYFPEPVSVSGNVTLEKHLVLVRFVKTVIFLGALAVGCIALLTWLMPPILGLRLSALGLLGCLMALTLVRRLLDGGATENALSAILLGVTIGLGAQVAQNLLEHGIPIWAVAVSVLQAVIYSLFCGRDFSFSGLFFLGFLSQVALWTALVIAGWINQSTAWMGMGIGFLTLFYLAYDIAMILRRRRKTEVPAAVADLFRDLINFVTYSIRIFLHWRRFGNL